MNANKAREYFSAYFEGELEAGLKQQFEQTLQEDAEVRSEYELFTHTMQFLADYKEEEIAIPFDLSEQISRKVDNHVWNQKQSEKPGLFAQWRLALVGGVAAFAILATVVTLNNPWQGEVTGSDFTGGISARSSSSEFVFRDGQVRLNVRAVKPLTVTVTDMDTETVIETLPVRAGSTFDGPLSNEKPEAAVLQISYSSDLDPTVVVLPGAVDAPNYEGEGTGLDFAKAVAQTFRTPVIVRLSDNAKTMAWSFDESVSIEDLPTTMKDKPASLVVQGNGFLVLSDN